MAECQARCCSGCSVRRGSSHKKVNRKKKSAGCCKVARGAHGFGVNPSPHGQFSPPRPPVPGLSMARHIPTRRHGAEHGKLGRTFFRSDSRQHIRGSDDPLLDKDWRIASWNQRGRGRSPDSAKRKFSASSCMKLSSERLCCREHCPVDRALSCGHPYHGCGGRDPKSRRNEVVQLLVNAAPFTIRKATS